MLRHRMFTFIASTVAATAALGAASGIAIAPAHAADAYVAIAYSPSAGGGGYAVESTEQQAIATAMADCQKDANDCQLAAWDENGCAAVAVSNTRWSGGHGPDSSAAQADALAENNGGNIAVVKCVSG